MSACIYTVSLSYAKQTEPGPVPMNPREVVREVSPLDMDADKVNLIAAAVKLGIGADVAADVAERALCDGVCSRRLPWAAFPALHPSRWPELRIIRSIPGGSDV